MQINFIYDKESTFYGEQLRALLYFTGVGDAGEIYVLCPKALHASLPQSLAFVIFEGKTKQENVNKLTQSISNFFALQ
jgi:hypothetical protein